MAQGIYKSEHGRQAIMALYEKVLAQWPVPCEQKYVVTDHGSTFIIAAGDEAAPPLVLLHGSGSNSATWAYDFIEYSRAFRVYAVDIPGEPGKSAEARFSCRDGAFRAWLDEVLDGLGLAQVEMGGMSLGAWAVLDYAIHRPGRVAAAALICPSGICQPRLSFVLAAILYMQLGDWGLQRMKGVIFRETPVSEDAERFFRLVGKHFNYRLEAPRLFSDQELQQANMPVLFLASERDAVVHARESAARLGRLLPRPTVRLFSDQGHAVINMAPEVTAYLQRCGSMA